MFNAADGGSGAHVATKMESEGHCKVFFAPFLSSMVIGAPASQKMDLNLRMETKRLGASTINAAIVMSCDDLPPSTLDPHLLVIAAAGEELRIRRKSYRINTIRRAVEDVLYT